MIAPAGRLLRPILLGALLVFGQAGITAAQDTPPPAATAPAGAALTATPAVISTSVQPGSQGSATLTLRAGQGLDVTIDPEGLGQSAQDGSFTYLPADQDRSPYSARPFIAVAPASFRMDAGSSEQVVVTFTVPAGAGDGERFAILRVNGKPLPGQGNVGLGMALGVSVVLGLSGTNQTQTGSIQDLTFPIPVAGQPLIVTNTLKDTGNSHFGAPPNQVSEKATLKNSAGDVVATANSTLSGNSLVPNFGRQFKLSLPSGQLRAGLYQLDVEATLANGKILDRATTNVEWPGESVAGATGGPSGDGPSPILIGILGALGGVALAAILLVAVGTARRRRRTALETSGR